MSFLDVGGRTWEDLTNDPKLIHMGHNCNHLPIDVSIKEAMITAVSRDEYRDYPPPLGFEELRQLIADDAGLSGARVLVTNGSTEAIYQTLTVLLRPDDEMIVTDPAWPHIGNFGVSLGARVITIPVYSVASSFKLDVSVLAKHITAKTRVIAIIDPLNPLGSNYTREEMEQICSIASSRGIYVLHDCTYRDFAGPAHWPALKAYERAIVTVSLSKSAGFAGLRLGAAVMSNEVFKIVSEHQISRLGVSVVAQRGAIAAYQTKHRWLPLIQETNRQNQAALDACFAKVDGVEVLVYPSMGNFVAADVTGTGLSAEQVVGRVLSAGFVIRSGAYTSHSFRDKFIRVTTTVPRAHVDSFCAVFPDLIRDTLLEHRAA